MTNLRRFLVVSLLLSTSMLCSAAQPPSCAMSCTSSAASQIGCNIYKVACFCNNTQFLNAMEGCIQETCAGSQLQDAQGFIESLCAVSSVGASTSSSSSRPFATAGTSHNAAVPLKRDHVALLGGALGALQVVAAII
ncbi:hypothetical protein EI94DRAFT_1740154 [Lactarius quietus]|nr:hypothetical protein EI94DRAFT_1740154 [Lactarius quietus]